ncbi:glutathione S-transferase family protein [Pendulispora albinea]|uniref:Glutathione S-transferase family protein n=1 Tax=Pendulispora albinea TaxID=2741071 RepID=A0ABZ2LWT7_9BACT
MNDSKRLLIGEDFSPWTEKACWALDHRRVTYTFRQYQPMLDEPGLRLRTKNFKEKATVPALLDGPRILRDSFAIARYAEEIGEGPSLFPEPHAQDIAAWNERSESALRAGRALFLVRLENDPAAQTDNVPGFVPAAVRPLVRPVVRTGISYLRRKHGVDDEAIARARGHLEETLSSLRAALAGGSRYLFGRFTYADVAMAVVCQFIHPVADRYIRLAPANRACWAEETLARSFRDILDWRDALYAEHRTICRS